jgi:hypothetical protein
MPGPGRFASRTTTRAEWAARQLHDHLVTTYKIQGEIHANGHVAVLRCGDLSVWIQPDGISWSTGELNLVGRPKYASVPIDQTDAAAQQVAERYRELCGLAGPHSVRIG